MACEYGEDTLCEAPQLAELSSGTRLFRNDLRLGRRRDGIVPYIYEHKIRLVDPASGGLRLCQHLWQYVSPLERNACLLAAQMDNTQDRRGKSLSKMAAAFYRTPAGRLCHSFHLEHNRHHNRDAHVSGIS